MLIHLFPVPLNIFSKPPADVFARPHNLLNYYFSEGRTISRPILVRVAAASSAMASVDGSWEVRVGV